MSTSPDDINALLAGAGLNSPFRAPPPNVALPTDGSQVSLSAANPGGFDPTTIEGMLALHGQANQQGNIARSRKLADQMRQDAGGLMQGKQVGRVYVGPKWWDAAAKLGADFQGQRMDNQATADSAGLDSTFQTTMADILAKYNKQSQANR